MTAAADSGPVEVVTHNAVGGGSDVFTRQMIKVMYENKIIDTQWPVRNVPAGDSIGAMSYMIERKGNAGLIAQVTPTWIATPMTVENAQVGLDQLTPITLVATEPQVIATSAKSPFNTFADFVDAAKKSPDTLVQSGGSSTANDALTRLVLQDTVGARWKFLSFEDTGSRITALLRGDANIMLGSAEDFAEQVKAGELKVIAVVGSERLEIFPDVSTTAGARHRLLEGARPVPCRDGCARHAGGRRAGLPGRPLEDGRDRGLEDPRQGQRPGHAEPPGRQALVVPEGTDHHRR